MCVCVFYCYAHTTIISNTFERVIQFVFRSFRMLSKQRTLNYIIGVYQ